MRITKQFGIYLPAMCLIALGCGTNANSSDGTGAALRGGDGGIVHGDRGDHDRDSDEVADEAAGLGGRGDASVDGGRHGDHDRDSDEAADEAAGLGGRGDGGCNGRSGPSAGDNQGPGGGFMGSGNHHGPGGDPGGATGTGGATPPADPGQI